MFVTVEFDIGLLKLSKFTFFYDSKGFSFRIAFIYRRLWWGNFINTAARTHLARID